MSSKAARVPSKKYYRLQPVLSPEEAAFFEELMANSKARTQRELVLRMMKLYKTIEDLMEDGKLIIEKDGIRHVISFI